MPLVGSTTAYHLFFTSIPVYLSVATIALLLVAEMSWFTSVRMHYKFAILLVAAITLSMSGLWHLLHWLMDINFGTTFLLDGRSQEAINAAVMHEFMYATVTGIVAGAIFGFYLRSPGSAGNVKLPPQGLLKTPEYPVSRPPGNAWHNEPGTCKEQAKSGSQLYPERHVQIAFHRRHHHRKDHECQSVGKYRTANSCRDSFVVNYTKSLDDGIWSSFELG